MIEEAKRIALEILADGKKMKMSEMREAFDSTRKFMIPLMEYLDKEKVTLRDGDYRALV
jgi:selenocysteine-specific elongation factor